MAKIYTFSKTISTQDSETLIEQETFSGLGTSNEGERIPDDLSNAPSVIINNDTNRRLYAANVTTSGFDVYGSMVGADPPYAVTYFIVTEEETTDTVGTPTVGGMLDLVEIYCGYGGTDREKIPRPLLYKLLNIKMKEFARRTGAIEKKSSTTSINGTQEYNLGTAVLRVTKVNFDGSIAHKIRFSQVDELQEDIS